MSKLKREEERGVERKEGKRAMEQVIKQRRREGERGRKGTERWSQSKREVERDGVREESMEQTDGAS